jgi:hypothetical protein
VSETVVEWAMLPLVPVTVRVVVDLGVFLFVVTVSVEVPEPEIDAGVNLALVPLGKPLADKLTVPVKPDPPVIVTV